MNFPLAAGGYRYRGLKLADPHLRGWDVYALQTGLNAGISSPHLDTDGILGPRTAEAIDTFQRQHFLDADGVAGVITQRAIAIALIGMVPDQLPAGLMKGQLEHESSFWLGNYTPAYPDGSRDCGVAQRNTNYTAIGFGFDVADSIEALAKQVKTYHGKYAAVGGRRAWELAAGAWNAPAYTDALAAGRTSVMVGGQLIDLKPTAPARIRIEAYMAAATVYMV